jgi:hypothetical protein
LRLEVRRLGVKGSGLGWGYLLYPIHRKLLLIYVLKLKLKLGIRIKVKIQIRWGGVRVGSKLGARLSNPSKYFSKKSSLNMLKG